MKKRRFTPGWPGSRGNNARQKIRRIERERDRKIAEIHATADRARAAISGGLVEPADVLAGEWYTAAYCSNCRYPIPLYPDPTRGEVKYSGGGTFRMPCPECGQTDEYPTEQVVSLEAVEAGSLPRPHDQE
jgi:hypothetical protein